MITEATATRCTCCCAPLTIDGKILKSHVIYYRENAPQLVRMCKEHGEHPLFRIHHGNGQAWQTIIAMDTPEELERIRKGEGEHREPLVHLRSNKKKAARCPMFMEGDEEVISGRTYSARERHHGMKRCVNCWPMNDPPSD